MKSSNMLRNSTRKLLSTKGETAKNNLEKRFRNIFSRMEGMAYDGLIPHEVFVT